MIKKDYQGEFIVTSLRKARKKQELRLIMPEINGILESEPAVLRIDPELIMLIGDIHGNLDALEFIIAMRKKLGCKKILFLGDYVDRGTEGTEVLIELFRMKLEEPEDVFLLRGNHESADMNIYYGFFEEIDFDRDFLLEISRTYERLPVAALVSGHTFCVHGGINGTENIDTITKEGAFPYLWNDPSERPGLVTSSRGSTVREFGPDIVEGFLKVNSLKRIIRGHTALRTGYEWWFDGKLLSLFSCPDYVGLGNAAAFGMMRREEIKIITFES
ncbi:metallophosphoesterase [Methanosarcina mazei]|jgi:serine/threonine-protein phosphatase PP1 catalytic subunit|uniref:Serine/threonine protein phosphatase BSU1 n=4 Tax=Methanosarcina mazei TaxID=2209 RepID=A0A0E3RJJ6_METMZ|nr:metallophosphoesterase [Methanosarcina mazei]AAM29798.1 Serine/threonine protein phosphatase [Methanosarcina mazei Go1]AKB61109.1 Serine/threonine protein phosphatase BSU1 [Methanosarcina mazei SarPi]AKB64424.1 Serine/threonine protein phosphatase BSU1 [Methanosarcina mazei S-6]AKB67755.1 Serine/threonine protein phosphatase BSU1 [Methanosarcina mazei LYC]